MTKRIGMTKIFDGAPPFILTYQSATKASGEIYLYSTQHLTWLLLQYAMTHLMFVWARRRTYDKTQETDLHPVRGAAQ